MTDAWIFQGNPKFYDVAGAVRAHPTIFWCVTQYKRQIKAGDTAYIWQTGGVGIVARARIGADPVLMMDEDDDPFSRSAQPDTEPLLYCPLEILALYEPSISRADCKANEVLASLPNLRFPNATNYPVTPTQEAAIASYAREARVGAT